MQTEAEKAAWDFAKANDISLVTILPNFVMGPVTSPTASSTSIGYFKVRSGVCIAVQLIQGLDAALSWACVGTMAHMQ